MNKRLKVLLGVLLTLAFGGGIALGITEFKTDSIVSHSGGPVSLPAGLTLPTSDVGDLHSSTYTATVTAGTNVDSVVAAPTLQYAEIGGMVAVYGQVTVNTTTDDTASAYTITLPMTRSANFSGTTEAAGVNGSTSNETGVCTATNAAKTVTCNYYAAGTGTQTVQVMFLYDKT